MVCLLLRLVLKHGKQFISIKMGMKKGEGVGAEGDLQLILYKRALSGEWIAFPCYKTHSVFLIYDICNSSEHCKQLMAYILVLLNLS